MVTEEDLIRTVVTAYTNGWRQVKLYFMCGLPTETDEDVLQIARLAHEVIKAGRAATGSRDIRCTVSIGGFVPKPHTPFQWASMATPGDDRPPAAAAQAGDQRRPVARQGDRLPLPRRPAVADRGPAGPGRPPGRRGDPAGLGGRAAASTAGPSTSRTSAGSTRRREALPAFGVDLDWFTTRERDEHEVLPWDHLDSGLDKEWLWQDWQDSLQEYEQDDCRWTPCFDCGVCPSMDTEIQIGPTGRKLLPLTPVKHRAEPSQEHTHPPEAQPEQNQAPVVQRIRIRYAKRGPLRFTSHRDFARAFERAVRRAGVPDRVLAGLHPAPEDLVRERGADRRRERGRVPGDRAAGRGRPGAAARRRWTRRSRPGWTCSRRSTARPGPAWPTASTRRAGGSSCRRVSTRPTLEARWPPSSAADEVLVERMTKQGRRRFDVRARRSRRSTARPAMGYLALPARHGVRYLTSSCGR